MRRAVVFFLLLPFVIFGDLSEMFSDGADNSHFHHVNVITGHLNLHIKDTVIEGAYPLPISRIYSSSGALERSYTSDPSWYYKRLRWGWIIQGGWSFFPHEHLLLEIGYKEKYFKAYISEPNGSMITYEFSHKKPNSKYSVINL